MKLLCELNDTIETKMISETNDENAPKHLYIEGIFMQTERKNRNGRIYPRPIMEKEVKRYIKEQVKTNRALGELEHPKTPKINLDRVSHRITDLWMEGNDVYGRARVLDTPMGNVVRGLIEGGTRLGVSSRALGSVKNEFVQDDFRLITVDCVADPSAHDAFVEGLYEGAEWVWDNGEWVQRTLEEGKKELDIKYKEEKVIELFQKFIKTL